MRLTGRLGAHIIGADRRIFLRSAGVRTEIATLEADLIDRIETRFSQLDGKINALAQEFKQFKGTAYGFGIAMTVVIPFVTWALNKFLK